MSTFGGTVNLLHLLHLMRRGFDPILRARRFDDELGIYKLQLQVLLSRCERMTNVINSGAAAINGSETVLQEREATLSETLSTIQETLRKKQREAAQVEADFLLTGGHLEATAPETTLNLKTLRLRTLEFLDKRKTQAAKNIEALKWAIYKKDSRDRFIADMSSQVLHLERQVHVHLDAGILLLAFFQHVH